MEFLENEGKATPPRLTEIQKLGQFLKNLEANFARLAAQPKSQTKESKELSGLVTSVVSELRAVQVGSGTASAGGSDEDPQTKISLYLLIDSYETLQRRIASLHLKAKSCEQLLVAVSKLRSKCEKIANRGNCTTLFFGLFKPPGLGSLDQLRIELETNFSGKSFTLEVKKGVKIDAMVLMPINEGESVRQREQRARYLEHQLEEKDQNASRDNSLKHSQDVLKLNDSIVPSDSISLTVICLPNSMTYEVAFYEQWLLRFFLERGSHLLLWNYRGFGRSTGSPSLEVNLFYQNIVDDGKLLIKHLKKKLHIKSLIIYGRSLGGHVAKALTLEADAVILDRTFSSISMLPKFGLGEFVQRIFDLCLDNYQINTSQLLELEAKKIVIYDSKQDEIVPYLSSLTFGLTVEMANLFFNKSNKFDIEQITKLAESRMKNWGSMKLHQGYFDRQKRLLSYSKLLLNQRDTLVLFSSLKRIIKLCLARANFKDQGPKQKETAPEIDLERLPSEPVEDLLDEAALAGIHEGRLSDPHFAKLTDPSADYSSLLASATEPSRLFPILDSIFGALSFVETGGLQLPAIFGMNESCQLETFQAFILSLMFWGSSLPLSAFARATGSVFDPLLSLRLALVRNSD